MSESDDLRNLPGLGKVDFVLNSSDNDKQDDAHEVIKMDEQEPINDKDCLHSTYKLDGDEIGDTVAVTCNDCPKGWYITRDDAEGLGLI